MCICKKPPELLGGDVSQALRVDGEDGGEGGSLPEGWPGEVQGRRCRGGEDGGWSAMEVAMVEVREEVQGEVGHLESSWRATICAGVKSSAARSSSSLWLAQATARGEVADPGRTLKKVKNLPVS